MANTKAELDSLVAECAELAVSLSKLAPTHRVLRYLRPDLTQPAKQILTTAFMVDFYPGKLSSELPLEIQLIQTFNSYKYALLGSIVVELSRRGLYSPALRSKGA